MQTIATVHGIAIRMYSQDYSPPHFQAIYGEHEADIAIASGDVIEGDLPEAEARLVKQWTLVHREELLANWDRARARLPLQRIAGSGHDQGVED